MSASFIMYLGICACHWVISMFENDALQLLATSEYNVFKLNDIITNRHDTPAPSTGISQIYLSQVTVNIISSKYSFHYFVLTAFGQVFVAVIRSWPVALYNCMFWCIAVVWLAAELAGR